MKKSLIRLAASVVLSVALVAMYLGERSAGNGAEMLFTADAVWYAPLNIHYSVGVDGISVAMLLLSAIIVFTGTFASWRMNMLQKEYFSYAMLCCTSGSESMFRHRLVTNRMLCGQLLK